MTHTIQISDNTKTEDGDNNIRNYVKQIQGPWFSVFFVITTIFYNGGYLLWKNNIWKHLSL